MTRDKADPASAQPSRTHACIQLPRIFAACSPTGISYFRS